MAKTKINSTSVKVGKKRIVCNVCGKERALGNYYKSSREEYEHIGYCTTCKECLRKSCVDINVGTVTKESIKSALKKLDRPLIDEVFNMIKERKVTNEKFLGEYLTQLNILPKYRDCTFSDTVDIGIEQEKILNARVDNIKEIEVTDEMRLFWGKGLSNEDYLDLQARFDRFMEAEEGKDVDYKKEMDYKKLVIWEFQLSKIQYDIDKIQASEKLQKMILELSNDLGIKAIQKKEDKNNNRHYIIGVITKFIEDVKKEPILKPSDYMKGYTKTEFEKELELHFTAPLLESFEMSNPFKDEWENEKKKYEPTKEEIDAFANDKGVDE